MDPDITYFAETNFREKRKFGIRQADRLMHTYILGKTGTGKSTLLETMIMQDIWHGRGCCLLDPHGDLAQRVYAQIPKSRKNDCIYLDLTNPKQPWRYNPFRRVSEEKRALVASGILNVFKSNWRDAWGPRLEHILRYIIFALLEYPNASFQHLMPMLEDEDFRANVLEHVTQPSVRKFWEMEYMKYKDGALVPLLNKLGAWSSYAVVRRLLSENKQDFSLRQTMDMSKILIVNLSMGIIGEDAAHLIGSLLTTSLGHAGFSRANITEEQRVPFHIFCDEFQVFTGSNIGMQLSTLRKFKISFTLAHQYLDQLTPSIRESVVGNVGTSIFFRVGGKDAPFIARELYPKFDEEDVTKLPNYTLYLKLNVSGKIGQAFSATSIYLKRNINTNV